MALAHWKKYVKKHMLPDTIRIKTSQSSWSVDNGGVPMAAPDTYREYEGSDYIPARFDASRAFKSEFLPDQVIVATEYTLNIPTDCVVDDSDVVIYDNREFRIRKVHNAGAYQVTKFLIVEEVGHD